MTCAHHMRTPIGKGTIFSQLPRDYVIKRIKLPNIMRESRVKTAKMVTHLAPAPDQSKSNQLQAEPLKAAVIVLPRPASPSAGIGSCRPATRSDDNGRQGSLCSVAPDPSNCFTILICLLLVLRFSEPGDPLLVL